MKRKSRDMNPILRHLNHIWQALLVFFFFALCRAMPLAWASDFGGWLGRNVAYRLGVTRRAYKHLALAFPEKTKAEQTKIVLEMWDNLGRVAAESPHLRQLGNQARIDFHGLEHLQNVAAEKRAAMFVSGHFANWEVGPMVTGAHGFPLAVVYRKPNNPYVDALVRWLRRPVTPALFPKGSQGARGMMRWLREGRAIGLLIDQKMREGIELSFFGHPAMTGIVPAQMALMTNAAILPAQVIRLKGCQFRVIIHPPLTVDETMTHDEKIRDLTQRMNDFLEDHIRAYPGQWLWLHRRWGRI